MNSARVDDESDNISSRKNILPRIKKDCEEIVRQFPDSEGGLNCQRLLQELNRRQLSLQMEKVNLPNQPFRALVQFKNISSLHYRIIPVTEDMENFKTRNRTENYWNLLVAQKPLKEINQPLPLLNDLRSHSAEIKIDALPAGQYILLASADAGFSLEKNPLTVQYFHVSRIAYINHGNDYFVLDRESGKPLPQADIAVWTQTYDYTNRRYNAVKRATLKSDLDGYFKLPVIGKDNEPVRFDINWKGDRLFMEESEYRAYSENKPEVTTQEAYEKNNRKLFLFTDRSIYRPGQLVYFKGIIITRDYTTKKHKIIPGYASTIKLHDANGEEIDSLAITAGEYGTFSGSFRLPETGLTGDFSLEDTETDGQVSFNVEEYKRPSFYVEYKKIDREYRLNDTVTATGMALGYAGNSMDGAKVKYRVTRIARFPFPWLYRGIWIPPQPEHGDRTGRNRD